VARGTVPRALFGADRYPVLMGRLGLPLLVAMALPPYFASLAFQNCVQLVTTIALVNVFLLAVLR
jgi:hypothetical protein